MVPTSISATRVGGRRGRVSSFAPDNHLLNYRSYNLPQTAGTAHTDCPRFTERRDWAQYWNGDTDGAAATNEEAVTAFIAPVTESWTMPDGTSQSGARAQVTSPDGTVNKIYFTGTAGTSSGWRRGLPALVETVQWRRLAAQGDEHLDSGQHVNFLSTESDE